MYSTEFEHARRIRTVAIPKILFFGLRILNLQPMLSRLLPIIASVLLIVIPLQIGLPGKSSVAGAMMMVLPNSMGICIYSPLVDKYGNSVRGLAFCEELVRVFNFHRYDNTFRFNNKFNPRRILYESKGDTIVSMIYAAANGDLSNLRRLAFFTLIHS